MKYLILISIFFSTEIFGTAYDDLADSTYRKLDNTLTIQIVPPTYRLKWERPRDLLYTIMKNKYYYPKTFRIIGHVTTELNCTHLGQKKRSFIGQGASSLNGYYRHLWDGYGFSIVNNPRLYPDLPLVTVPGKLEDEKTVFEEYERLIKKNNFGALSIKITEQECLSSLNFINEYKRRTALGNGAGTRYGFGASTEKYEGAGCATLVEAIANKAGQSELVAKMQKTLFIPDELIGSPEQGDEKAASLWTLLTTDLNMKNKSDKARTFIFPDPQELYDYLNTLKTTTNKSVETFKFKNSKSKLVLLKPLEASSSL